jgi:protein phosphatase
VSWTEWLRNLWNPRSPATIRPRGPETTIDDPALSAVSLASGSYQVRFGVVTTRGNVRESNEDNYFVPGLVPHDHSSETEALDNGQAEATRTFPAAGQQPGLFLVADGMGGQLAGEKASEMAVAIIPEKLGRLLATETSDDDRVTKRVIREAVAEANKEILAQSHLIPEFQNMGTTLVLLLLRRDHAYVSGIGDSRVYRLRDRRLELLTKDHSLAWALEEEGIIGREEVETHRFRNVLYLYLGSRDARDGPEDIRTLDLARGDRFLLASDGLTGVVKDEVIAEVLAACDDPQRAAQALVHRALENRSKDNITCLVIEVV